MLCRVIVVSSPQQETFFLPNGLSTIGRESDNNVQFVSDTISRHHVRINNMPNICELEDLNSFNGTFVNGERISHMVLRHGYEIRMGDVVLRFEECGDRSSDDATRIPCEYSERTSSVTMKIDYTLVDARAKHLAEEETVHKPPMKPMTARE